MVTSSASPHLGQVSSSRLLSNTPNSRARFCNACNRPASSRSSGEMVDFFFMEGRRVEHGLEFGSVCEQSAVNHGEQGAFIIIKASRCWHQVIVPTGKQPGKQGCRAGRQDRFAGCVGAC